MPSGYLRESCAYGLRAMQLGRKSPFLIWFREQFGARPTNKPLEKLREDWLQKDYIAAKAKEIYDQTREWEDHHNAALKGWCAKD